MPLSTSVSSNNTTPLASTSLSASSPPIVHAAVGRTSGNAAEQVGPSVTTRPCGAPSSLKVSVQRRSRSGLESSHTPTSAPPASLTVEGAGACCATARSAQRSNNPPAKNRVMPASPPCNYDFFTDVSGTGVLAPLPANHEIMLFATGSSMARGGAGGGQPARGGTTTLAP